MLTSVDMEGTKKGFDFDLIKKVTEKVNVPIIASGGFGRPEDMLKAHLECFADAIAIADAFHFNRVKIQDLKEVAIKNNIQVRKI